MFNSIKNNFQRQKFIKMFAFIVASTQVAPGFAYVAEADADKLAASEPTFVSVNKALKDANGNVAVSATAEGIKASQETSDSTPAAPKAENASQAFSIEDAIPLPVIQRGGVRTETYPFDKLAVGQSFFVPATAERPNPAKSLASTVSSASRRYKDKDGRRFTIRSVEVNGVKGARIWRAADSVKGV